MRLKVLTTALVVFGIVLMVGWPWLVGPKPPAEAGTQALATYGQRLMIYFLVTVSTWITVAVLALIIARRARDEFLAEEKENLRQLIEGTLRDHERR